MTLPPHFSKIAAEEARRKNEERSLKPSNLGATNKRRPVEAHQARFIAWLFSHKG